SYMVKFKNGVVGEFLVTQRLAGIVDYLDILGTKGRIRAEWPSESVTVQSTVVPEYNEPTTITPTLPNYHVMYDVQMRAWVEAVVAGKEPPIGVDAAVDVLRIIDGVFESAKTGQRVVLK
ncbi:MAG: Gfo/Idh/MocA family oxidoreductase, partial [Chloroflexi bacterium]|nr:Gfo/Idh/MocA family oxidoreductase [Chloroflexota bacterium]